MAEVDILGGAYQAVERIPYMADAQELGGKTLEWTGHTLGQGVSTIKKLWA